MRIALTTHFRSLNSQTNRRSSNIQAKHVSALLRQQAHIMPAATTGHEHRTSDVATFKKLLQRRRGLALVPRRIAHLVCGIPIF